MLKMLLVMWFLLSSILGGVVNSGESITEVESTKSVSDIYAPITGTIIEVNHDLTDSPEF